MGLLKNSKQYLKFGARNIEVRPFINGRYQAPEEGKKLAKTCPADGEKISDIFCCSQVEVNASVQAAQAAFEAGLWRDLSKEDRRKILLKFAELVESHSDYIAYLDTIETGRAYSNFTQHSLPKAVAALRWFAEAIDKQYEMLSTPSHNQMAMILREPLGVVAAIIPWNDPMVVAMWKIAPALAVGNSVVVKPAEQSTYSMLYIASLAQQAGLPDGVLNVVTGEGPVAGRALVINPFIRGVFFTGSSEVGKEIISQVGSSGIKKIGLECGGKSAFILSENYFDLDKAATTLVRNMFYNQGQICSAPSRAIVHKNVMDRFLGLVIEKAKLYSPDNPFDEATLVGSMSSKEQYLKVKSYIDGAHAQGLVNLANIRRPTPSEHGFFIQPTVFQTDTGDYDCIRDEIFGPVLTLQSFSSLSQAVKIANDTRFGLAASIWSDRLDEALTVSRALNAGIVHVNSYGDDDNSAPFGGVKDSGLGRDKSLFAFEEYTTVKTIWVNHQR